MVKLKYIVKQILYCKLNNTTILWKKRITIKLKTAILIKER